jgi:class 3 adenylate cyclase
VDIALDHIEEFLSDLRRPATPARVLATVLFTDIVASTEQASRVGDGRWRELLDVHDEAARRVVEEFQGQLIKTTGDGRASAKSRDDRFTAFLRPVSESGLRSPRRPPAPPVRRTPPPGGPGGAGGAGGAITSPLTRPAALAAPMGV